MAWWRRWFPDQSDDVVDYEVAKSEVFRRLNAHIQPLQGADADDAALAYFDRIEAGLHTLSSPNTARAYRYWLPHFREKAKRWRDNKIQWDRNDAARHKVPELDI